MPDSNPFGSPALESMPESSSGNAPSLMMLAVGVLAGIPLALGSSYEIYLDPVYTPTDKLLWGMADLVVGIGMGLGIAFLWQAIATKQFSTLAPGHWGLIASIFGATIVISESVPEFLSAVFYVVAVLWSREATIWKAYGWGMMVSYLITGVVVIISLFFAEDIALMLEAMLEGESSPAKSALVSLYYGVAMLGSLVDLVVLVLMISGIVHDLSNQKSRDAFHYIGLVFIMTISLIYSVVGIIIFAIAE